MLASSPERAGLEAPLVGRGSDAVELAVLTADDIFLQTLRDAVGSSRRLWHVATPEKVSDLLLAGSVGILVVDAQSSRYDVLQFIAQVRRQFPDLVIIVAGDRGCETVLAAQISTGLIYRFIHKPMSPGRAKLFAEAAVRKYGEQRRRPTPASSVARTAGLDRRLVAGAAIGVGALVLAAGLFLARALRTDHGPAPETSHQPGAEHALLARAAAALAADRLAGPGRDNALAFYRSVLATNPADATARAGVAEVQERLLARAENALLGERLDEAQAAIETARTASVETGRIAFLSAEFGKLRDQRAAAQARALSPAPGSGRRSKARPLDASAAPGALTPAATPAVAATPGIATPGPLASPPLASPPPGIATPGPLASPPLASPPPGIATPGPLASPPLASPPPGIATPGPLASPPPASPPPGIATPAAAAPERIPGSASEAGADTPPPPAESDANQQPFASVVPANTLVTVKTVQPRYPEAALRDKVEGWVELDFTVAATGEVKDIAVHRASVPGVFDQAARQALKQWRYRPAVRDSKPVEQRARIRIRFVLA